MAQPSTRIQLREYCLRKLGFPVIDINVDDDQLEDRIDDALQKFRDYHFDGTERVYLSQKLNNADIMNGYLKLCDNIIGVSRVFAFTGTTVGSTSSTGFNMFDINYQLRLNDFYNLTSSSYTYYVIAREHLAMLDMIVTGQMPFTYNKKVNKLEVITDWRRFNVGNYMAFEAHRIVDPETHDKVYNDTWLKRYTTALFKQQWGTNLKKYGNYVLPGGLVINGQQIYDEASIDIEKLDIELRDTYEEPTMFLVG